MRKLSALGLALLFVVVQVLFGTPANRVASAQPADDDPLLKVRVEQLTPRMVGPDDRELTVDATVTNIGDRPVSDIVAAVQVGAPQGSASELARSLAEPPPATSGESQWVGASDRLERGESARLVIKTPLAELGLTQPGVHPLLLNVNGTPAYGGTARLAAVNLFLPVLGSSGSTPASTTMLWPIAAREPKVVAAPHDGPMVLADDDLAAELAPGGRLQGLVAAAEHRRNNPELFGSLCFAVDPELLETVDAMSRGYSVHTGSGTVEGTGSEHAKRWLDELRGLVANHCVIELPYADADLSALTEVDTSADLVGDAVTNGATILNVLHLEPHPGVVWTQGRLTSEALREVDAAGAATVITSPETATRAAGSGVHAVPYDPLVAAGFGHASARQSEVRVEQPNVATQNAVAALALRGGLGDEAGGGAVLVAPPHDWNVAPDELATMLDSLARLHEANLVRPAPLDELLAADGDAQGGTDVPAQDGSGKSGASAIPDGVIATLSDIEATTDGLQKAMSVDPTRQVEPISLIQPLRNAVIRATSTSWASSGDYRSAAASARRQVGQLKGEVTVSTPSQPVSLASESSPLPVTLGNDLPVAITVRVKMDNSPGLRPATIEDTPLAANSRVNRWIPAETLRSGRFIVNVSVTTPGGTTLGRPAQLELMSSEFGVVMVVLTATAGAALVLLSGHRIYRRVKTRGEERG